MRSNNADGTFSTCPEGFAAVNGKITPIKDAQIPIIDRGFLYGDDVFETILCFGKTIMGLAEHLERLRESAAEIDIEIPWSDEEMRFEMETLVAQFSAPKKSIRLMVSRGSGLGLRGANLTPNRIVLAVAAPLEDERIYTAGLKVKRRALSYTMRGANPKVGNYLDSIVALRRAAREGYEDIVWNNSSDEFCEAAAANIFFIGRDGDLVEIATPSAQSGILLGITRRRIIQLLELAKIPVTERIIYVDELARFDEAFLCSTVRGLVPIAEIDQHKFHTARKESTFRHIERLYMAWVETQLGFRPNWRTGQKS